MPTFNTTQATWTNNSDANFRLWGSFIAAKLLASGLVQTADTGQINWTTVTTPSGINTYQGYEIWRFDDALQATAPVYIKIQYGEGDGTDGPGIRVQFGSGSNGSGTLTGNLSNEFDAEATSKTSTATMIGSGNTARFVMAAYQGSNTHIFGFERTKDASGNDTTEGVYWFAKPTVSGTGVICQVWNTTLGNVSPQNVTTLAVLFPSATGVTGTQTIVAPVFPEKGVFMNPILNIVGYYTGDITPDSNATVYMYGAGHTYYFLSTAASPGNTSYRGAGSGTEAAGIRYE